MCARSRTRSSSPGPSRRPRRLKRRSTSRTASSMTSPPSTQGATVSISNGSSGGNGAGGGAPAAPPASPNCPRGRVINALTIRGADQVSLRVTVAEIRRDIIKQLGVNLSGSGPNGSFTLDNPFAINGARRHASEGDAELGQGQPELQRHLAGVRATGRRPYARRADRDRGLRRDREIPRRRHDSHSQ